MKKLLALFFLALVTPAFSQIYSRVGDYHDGLALVSGYTSANGYSKKYGYVNEYNKLVIPLKYEHAESFYSGTAVVGIGVKYGVINKNQAVVVPMIYDEIQHRSSYYVVRKGREWGVLDHSGKVFIPLKDRGWAPTIDFFAFRSVIGGFRFIAQLYDSNGKALFPDGCFVANEVNDGVDGLWNTSGCGCCNMNTGKLETGFRFSTRFSDGLAKVVDGDRRCGLMEAATGELLLPIEYDDILAANKERFKVVRNGITFFKDRNGGDEYMIKQECRGVYIVTKAGKDGLIDEDSMGILEDCIYDEIIECGGVLRVSKDGKMGLATRETRTSPFNISTPIEYDEIVSIPYQSREFGQRKMFCYRKDGKWAMGSGYKTENGFMPSTRFIFDDKPVEKGSNWLVVSNGKYGLYSKDELTELAPCIYDEIILIKAAGFFDNYNDVWTAKKGGKYGIMQGKRLVVPFEFDEINWFDRFVKIRKNDKCDFVEKQDVFDKKLPVELRFEDIKYLDSDCISHGYHCDYYFAVKNKGKWGYIKVDSQNPSGEIVIKPKYDEAGKFINGRARVMKGEKAFYIDKDGKKVK